jgi:hypothetical protein
LIKSKFVKANIMANVMANVMASQVFTTPKKGDTPSKVAKPRNAKRKLKGVEFHILYADPPVKGDQYCLTLVDVRDIVSLRPNPELRLEDKVRLTASNIQFKGNSRIFSMHYFARVEKGKF